MNSEHFLYKLITLVQEKPVEAKSIGFLSGCWLYHSNYDQNNSKNLT